jgi:outer membrane protein OmpA-like peptidoglycan-associated protein
LDIDEFEFNKTTIPPKHIPSLTALRKRLAAEPGATVVCTGNTDTVGNEQYNYKLGMERAAAVRDFLVEEKGVDAKRIKIDSKGEKEPAKGEPPAKPDPDPGVRDPKNRRVEVVATFPATKAKGKSDAKPKGKVKGKGKR